MMTNKGNRHELKVKNEYLKMRYIVMKGAASKWFNEFNDAKCDLIAINPQTSQIVLIQCKHPAVRMSKNKKEKIMAPLKALEGQYVVTAELE